MVSPRKHKYPKTRSKPKPKPKPVINYPPVPTRKWIPPDQRKKKPRPKGYVKPEGISQKLEISTLEKVWHHFKIIGESAFLFGSFSQCNKRFLAKTNGYQGSCNCVVAVALSTAYDMKHWTTALVDKILELGDQLYLKTIGQTNNKCRIFVDVDQVFNSFYLDDTRITMAVGEENTRTVDKYSGDQDQRDVLAIVLQKFLKNNISGIFCLQHTCLAFWRTDNSIYLFDPCDHERDGLKLCGGIIGEGVSVVYKLKSYKKLASCILNNTNRRTGCNFIIYPVFVQKIVRINRKPPNSLNEIYPDNLEICEKERKEKLLAILETKKKVIPPPLPPPTPVEVECRMNNAMIEISPDVTTELVPTLSVTKKPSWFDDKQLKVHEVPKSRIPVEKPRTPSITFFIDLFPEKQGILRASTHQCDPGFTNYDGKQALSNAVSAIAMLRIYKSKYWIKRIVDDVLKAGNIIYHDTKKEIGKDKKLKKTDMTKKIIIGERIFVPVIEDYAAVGKLQSTDGRVLDLLPALIDFLKDNDSCILLGPIILAIWVEDNYFYMFDPNERDQYGRVITKQKQIGSNMVLIDYIPGVACVTWYKSLKDLVRMYMSNVEKSYRRDSFSLCKVQINDYVEIPDPWYNFQPLSKNKWILRGTFNQNNQLFSNQSRNIQCTANATMALAYSKMKPLKQWDSDTLDQILLAGDQLYCNTVERLKQKNAYKHPMLMADEVNRKFDLEDKEVALEIEDCLVNGIITADEESGILDLKRGFEEFFRENDTGVLTSHSITVGILKKDEVYYYFDSHSRDENGVVTSFGTSCILRISDIDELAKSIETNLGPNSQNMYNISRIMVKLLEKLEGGSRPPLNEYVEVSIFSAILRSLFSEASVERFPLNKSKQTIPMCITALLMNSLLPADTWSQEVLDKILEIGDKYYVDSMSTLQTITDEDRAVEPEYDEDGNLIIKELLITTDNIKKDYKIGVNKFEIDFEDVDEGNIDEFKEKIEGHYGTDELPDTELPQVPELIFETDDLVLAIWKDENVYYLFDPKPRDEFGQVYGKDDWSERLIFEDEDEYEYEDENAEKASDTAMEEKEIGVEEGAGDAIAEPLTQQPALEPAVFETPPDQIIGDTEYEEKLEDEEPAAPLKEKQTSDFWRNLRDTSGRACTMWFTKFYYLINHIIENTPPNKRQDIQFKLKTVKITNNPVTKDLFDPELDQRQNIFEGDWYEFKEVDYGFWILRGTRNLDNEMYPEINRNKQDMTSCFAALGFAHLYCMTKFKPLSVDYIQRYGDRLYSFTLRTRKNELKKNTSLRLSEKEILAIIENEKYSLMDYCNKYCVSENMITLDITQAFLYGDINAEDYEKPDELLDVNRAMQLFFENNNFGIICCKDLALAIWKGDKMYYMYDPYCRSPNGGISTTGVPCITRFLKIKQMADTFIKTLPVKGLNTFMIHKVQISSQQCPRDRHPPPDPEVYPDKLGGYKFILPGKYIVRGNISQESPEFDRGSNIQSAPIAFIALTMSLIHKPKTWSKPIIDEIIRVGDQLYIDSVTELGYEFNPWEDCLDVYKVKNDYKIGVLKANCELRNMDQRGVIDIKNSPTTLNLRQGLEKFFEENTHGIFITNGLVLAVWEEDDNEEEGQETLIYIFDPNPRGPTGLPLTGGVGCTVSFLNAKLCSDHIISCINDKEKRMESFVIVPVEIIVGHMKTKGKFKAVTQPEVTLKKCDPKAALEAKRQLRKIAEMERRKKEAKRQFLLGRTGYYQASGGIGVLRGIRSQYSDKYDEHCRGNQDIPCCMVAFVMHKIVSVEKWTHKNIDSIMDDGNQLYIDSYVTYNTKNQKLGLKNVLRRFYLRNAEAQVVIYKPIDGGIFTAYNLSIVLTSYFDQEQFCMLNYKDHWISIFLKSGQFYVFDPHDGDIEGNKSFNGSAIVLRFINLEAMCLKIVNNIIEPGEEIGSCSLVLISLKSILRK